MLRSPKSSVGWVARKAVALIMAYSFFATCIAADTLAGQQPFARTTSGGFMSSRTMAELLRNKLASSLPNLAHSSSTNSQLLAAPVAATNVLANAPLAMMQAGGGTASSISFNFNATAIPAGDTVWFSAVLKLNGAVPSHPVSIAVHNSTIQFTAGTTNYSLHVPDSVVTFSPTTTTSSANFDTANNPQPVWLQNQLNPQPSGNTLLQAFAFPVPAGGLPGGIKNVTWTNNFSSDTSNITLNWQWAAAVYTGCVNTTYNSDDVKPTDDNSASIYKSSDHAGTPEACKTFVAQGATGGGASNYTGSLSGTASVTPPVVSASPTITATINPPPNANGWNNTNTTVSFSCSDQNFAIATCPAPVTVNTEGAGHVVSVTAVDQTGATANTSVTVNIDKTSPSITASATSSSGSGSVLTLPVTITFTCTDAVSGVASCPSPIQVTTAGANQVFSGTATDKAGNTANTSIALNTENAPLAITATLSPLPVNGWNNSNVNISYQCTGGVPPVQCPQAQNVTAEAAGQQISATATDGAGQSATVTNVLNIDKTPPTLTATVSPAPNAAGWNTGDVTISYACSDNLSGVPGCPPQRVMSTEGKAQQITASVTDAAGNTTTTTTTINLEKTAPNITASIVPSPNAAGWNNADVTVSFTCAPSVSDIVSCSGPVPVTTEGSGQHVSGTVSDQAGKSNTATVTVNLDKTPPSIGITAPISASYINNNHPPITISYSDTGSGIEVTTFHVSIDGVDQTAAFTASATGATGSPAVAFVDGVHTITVSISDVAGNPATATSTFTVDTIPPQVTLTQPANGFFTNAASLVVTGTVVDASPVTVTVEGTNVPVQNGAFTSAGITLGTTATQVIHVVATDAAGNSTPINLTINIDRNPPTITPTIAPPPNAAGWNNTAVTLSFICADAESGIATCPDPVQLPNEGANQTVTRTTTDKAGNTTTVTVTVNIDKTPPVIVGTPAPAPNAAGWNTTDVTVTWACSDNLSGVPGCPPPQVVSTEGKAQQISATVTDKAGNSATATALLNIEKTAPAITGSASPAPNAAGWNNTNVTVSFVCTPSASDIVTCQSPVPVTTEGKAQNISGSVTDQAGKTNTTSVTVNLDKTPPLISASAAPPANGAGWNNTDVVISYLCSDSLSGIALCPPPTTVSTEGSAEKISAQAVDIAGNSSAVTTTLNIDKTPPTITASAAPPPNGAGWNNTNVTVSYNCTDNLSGVASCPSSTLVASEGQNQNISGQATDVAGNVATGSIALNIDKTAPTIVQLSTPDHISRLHGGQVSVTVNDNFMVTQVGISVNGTTLGTFTSAPYQADLTVPADANPGDTLTVTATATDEAGNTQTSSRGVRVAADGVIVGQVLSDTTSFPIQGAVVQSLGTTSVNDQTDDHGRYSLQASDSHLFLAVTSPSPATTTVEREVFVQEGVGTVPVDARLTPLAAPIAIGSAGGTLTAGNISLTVPSGVVGDGTSFQLTSLTGQGLPGLLPMGWSPLAAFDLRATSSAMNLSVAIAQMPNTVAHLVTYSPALHAWTLVAQNLQSISGTVSTTVPTPGAYALVVADSTTPPITIPNPGEALAGIPMQLLDSSASSSGSLSPAILPPTGGTSTATLGVQTSAQVPSGTVIQANISEKFSLKSGDVVSEENRSEDIVLYNALAPANSTLGAQFAVTPSRKYTNTQLLTGKVHLDILAGREGVRGQPGGSNPLTLSDGVSTLSVPSGALNEDTAISLQSISFEDFVPTTGSQSPIQEVLVDFSGDTLNVAAQLSISATGLNPADTYLLTKVERIDGVPYMALIGLAQISGGNLTSVASPGLPGVTQGGEYVFYDIPAPAGFVQGVVSSSAGPVQALVQTDSLQIVNITGADGRYIVPALAGSANVKASAPHTNLIGSASVQVTAGQTTQANIPLQGAVTSAVVSPADGTLGVPSSTTITITTTAPLNPQSIQQSNLVLLKGTAQSGTPVVLQPFVLSTSETVLSFAPQANLDPATQYTIQVSGLADTFGGAIVVPTSSFTTKAVAPLNFDPNAITFSFPDQNGNIHVSAPANSLPPGTQILIIDQTSALVFSLTAVNDGSVSGDFLGTINDVLQITVTAPNGATSSFTRSQFVAPDGTTAVGAGGGTVTGPGGVELRIPNGALDKAASFQIESFGPELFPDRPDFPGANFGGGLKVTSADKPTFSQEVKLAFPKPADAPDGAFYYVYRRLVGPNNESVFETVDEAFVEGQGPDAKVVTASYPFAGDVDSIGTYQILPTGQIGVDAAITTYNVLAWTIDAFAPLLSTAGVVTGVVRRPKFGTAPNAPVEFEGIPGIAVTFADANGNPLPSMGIATTQADGRYTLFNPHYKDGNATVVATVNGEKKTAVAFEFLPTDVSVFQWLKGLFIRYKQVASANLTFSPAVPPPPAPQVEIHTFKGDTNQRTEVFGIVLAGTSLTIGVKSNNIPLTLSSGVQASIQQGSGASASLGLGLDSDTTANKMDLIGSFVPTQAGSYKITVTVPAVFGGQPIVASHTFLVIANAGGGNNQVIPGTAPDIITALLVPQDGATDVATDVLPQIVFTQPVINVKDNVRLFGAGHFVDITISAVGVDAQGNQFPIADLNSLPSNTPVTSITLQPVGRLQFNTGYNIDISGGILNTDPVSPLSLAGRDYSFTTFIPQALGTVGTFDAVGMFVANNRVYVAARDQKVHAFDISNPLTPKEVAQGPFPGVGIHMAGAKNSPFASGGALIAAASTEFIDEGPSNLWFYQDVTPPNQQGVNPNGLQRIGAVSLTGSTEEGTILRVAIKDNFAYTVTFPKGIQMIDLSTVMQRWSDAMSGANGLSPGKMFTALSTPGGGWATDAVVSTVAIPSPDTGMGFAQTNGLAVDDFLLPDGSSQTLVLATGRIPLLVVNPQTSSVLFNNPTPLPSTLGALVNGGALALGTVPDPTGAGNDRKVAVIVGNGQAPADPFYQSFTPALASGPIVAIMDITVPNAPSPLGFFLLDTGGRDVRVQGTRAFVSTATGTAVIDFSNPAKPMSAGTLPGSIGKLGFADPNLVLSSLLGTGGLHIVQLDPLRCSTLIGPGIPAPTNFSATWVNWSTDVVMDSQHGLTMQNVVLGQRHMADSMSLPYFTLQTTGHPAARCQLTTSGPVCDNTDPATRNRLVSFQSSKNVNNLTISATYVIDRIFGDPETLSGVHPPQACLVVTENFEFDKTIPNDACEPSGELVCTRFKPTVEYQYFHAVNAPDLEKIQMAQRFQFNAIEFPPYSNTQSSNGVALFHDCDGLLSSCTFGLPFSGIGGFLPIHVVKAFDGENPLLKETKVKVVQGGNQFNATDDKGTTRSIDNIHQTTQKAVDEPGLHPGCPDCVHVHWRWDANLDHALHPSIVRANFNGNHGLPLIPAGSNQDIDIAVVRGDRDPNPPSVDTLFSSGRGSLDPQVGDPKPVLWYLGTGYLASDQFFTHGGFFSDRGTLQGMLLTNISATASGVGTYTVTFTATGISTPINFQMSTIGDFGGTFSQTFGVAFPDQPVSLTFAPTPGGQLYIVNIHVQDPVTLGTADEQVLIQTPF